MKRYTYFNGGTYGCGIVESPDGEFVRLDDVATLKKERDLYKSVVIAAIGRILSMPPVYNGPLFEMLKAMREAIK